MIDQERIRRRLIRKFERAARNLGEIIHDVEAWNRMHPTKRPLDVERERVGLHLLLTMLGHLYKRERFPRPLAARFQWFVDENVEVET